MLNRFKGRNFEKVITDDSEMDIDNNDAPRAGTSSQGRIKLSKRSTTDSKQMVTTVGKPKKKKSHKGMHPKTPKGKD